MHHPPPCPPRMPVIKIITPSTGYLPPNSAQVVLHPSHTRCVNDLIRLRACTLLSPLVFALLSENFNQNIWCLSCFACAAIESSSIIEDKREWEEGECPKQEEFDSVRSLSIVGEETISKSSIEASSSSSLGSRAASVAHELGHPISNLLDLQHLRVFPGSCP